MIFLPLEYLRKNCLYNDNLIDDEAYIFVLLCKLKKEYFRMNCFYKDNLIDDEAYDLC